MALKSATVGHIFTPWKVKKIETKYKEKIKLYFKALKSLMTKQKTSLFDIPGTNHKFYQNKSLGKRQKIPLKSMKDMGYSSNWAALPKFK